MPYYKTKKIYYIVYPSTNKKKNCLDEVSGFSAQLKILENTFALTPYPTIAERMTLIKKTGLPEARIQVYFFYYNAKEVI